MGWHNPALSRTNSRSRSLGRSSKSISSGPNTSRCKPSKPAFKTYPTAPPTPIRKTPFLNTGHAGTRTAQVCLGYGIASYFESKEKEPLSQRWL